MPPQGKPRPVVGNIIYLVLAQNNGRAAWYYVAVEKLKLPLFKRGLKSGNLTLTDYGEVLCSGWGAEPPIEVAARMAQCPLPALT